MKKNHLTSPHKNKTKKSIESRVSFYTSIKFRMGFHISINSRAVFTSIKIRTRFYNGIKSRAGYYLLFLLKRLHEYFSFKTTTRVFFLDVFVFIFDRRLATSLATSQGIPNYYYGLCDWFISTGSTNHSWFYKPGFWENTSF